MMNKAGGLPPLMRAVMLASAVGMSGERYAHGGEAAKNRAPLAVSKFYPLPLTLGEAGGLVARAIAGSRRTESAGTWMSSGRTSDRTPRGLGGTGGRLGKRAVLYRWAFCRLPTCWTTRSSLRR